MAGPEDWLHRSFRGQASGSPLFVQDAGATAAAEAGEMFSGGHSFSVPATQDGHFILTNPAASGKKIVLLKTRIATDDATSFATEFKHTITHTGALRTTNPMLLGGAAGVGTVHTGADVISASTSTGIVCRHSRDAPITYDGVWVLLEGDTFAASVDVGAIGASASVHFEWWETDL